MKLTTIQAHFESKTRRGIISNALNECALYCDAHLEPGFFSDCQACYYARVIRYLSGTLTLTEYELSLIYNQQYDRLDTYPESEDDLSW